MKRFLKMFLIWVGVGLAIAYAWDAMITLGLRKTDIRKYAVWNDIYKGKAAADIVVLGSSRAWCGYNTYVMDSLLHCDSYNLGIDGHSLEMQLVRYDTYRRFNPAPRLILVNTDFLSTFNVNADPRYEREQFFPYITDGELISRVKEVKRLTVLDRYFPLVRYYGYREDMENGLAAFGGKKDFADGGMHKGYRGNEYPWKETESALPDSAYRVDIDTALTHLLDAFAARCKNEGIRVSFVKSPVYAPLRDRFSHMEDFDSVLEEVAAKNGVPVLDYSQSAICDDRNCFYNASHLNKQGSERFTRMLCQDLDSLAVL